MTAIILIGIPASGKSTFCRQRLYDTHLRLNLDMLKTRRKENILLQACLIAKAAFVVDNTNATILARAQFIEPAKAARFRVIGYYFSSKIAEALQRNSQRPGKARVPDRAVHGIAGSLELPQREEGFDELWYVRMDGMGGFIVEEWKDQ
ncbi:MAG TPA: AAA family ATPase [Desulfuromonadaceae bacterium]|jgi:predicted kinase